MWKSSVEVRSELEKLDDVSQLASLFALRLAWQAAIYVEGYSANPEWASLLVPNSKGKETLDLLRKQFKDISEQDFYLASFVVFYHHDLFFDATKSNIEKIRNILEQELLERRIQLPSRYGRILYDKFNDLYPNPKVRTDHLMSPETMLLLKDTPHGVYQVYNIITGPLGIISSNENRFVPPSRSIPLWHCPDTGCQSSHSVKLMPGKNIIEDTAKEMDRFLEDRLGPCSEWLWPLSTLDRTSKAKHYADILSLIADCIIGTERTALTALALKSESKDFLREILVNCSAKKRNYHKNADEVAAILEPEEQLQLLMSLSDKVLINLLDEAIFLKIIKMPFSETRKAVNKFLYYRDVGSEISALGIRSVNQNPMIVLASSIWNAYQAQGMSNDLEWHLKGENKQSTHEALISFIKKNGPEESIQRLVLSSPKIAEDICNDLNLPFANIDSNDKKNINRVLWKFGFDPMRFDDSITRFKDRLSELKDEILLHSPIESEDSREEIRKAGVNVFVSLEDILEKFISYNIWLLSSDHFGITKFTYSPKAARYCVSQILGPKLKLGSTEFVWKVDNTNPLGTLLAYLRASTNWMQSLSQINREDFLRSEDDYPHFANDEHLPFAFTHNALWADSDPISLRQYIESFSTIVKRIEQSELAMVRNGLDHFRSEGEFPTTEKLLAFITFIEQAIGSADLQRFLPNVFWLQTESKNRFNSTQYEFHDYADRKVGVDGPSLMSGLGKIDNSSASLIAPYNLLGKPNSTLIFKFQESSEHLDYWRNYPRRRLQIAEEQDLGKPDLKLAESSGTS